MGDERLSAVLRHLRRLVTLPSSAHTPDALLLERYALRRDEEAFTALVHRHGPLVWGVCRRVLGREHDAEDAFQATFLVLARKARSIRQRDALGGWLYRVAHHIAVRARQQRSRRRLHDERASRPVARDADSESERQELRSLLDEELSRLPEKYRIPLVLCYLEGRTHAQAAVELGCRPGSMSWRLARGHELLRARLARRGLGLSATMLAVLLADEVASARVPATLASSLSEVAFLGAADKAATAGVFSAQAITLTKGALHAMWITKIKVTASLLLATATIGVGGGTAAYHVMAAGPGNEPVAKQAADVAKTEDLQRENASLKEELHRTRRQIEALSDRLKVMTDRVQELAAHSGHKAGSGRESVSFTPPRPDMASSTTTSTTGTAASERYFADVRERFSDEAELLRAQLDAKEAELHGAEMMLQSAEHRAGRLKQLVSSGTVSQEGVEKANGDVVVQQAQLLTKRAEMKELQVRLKQALRKLESASTASTAARKPATTDAAQQLKSLESKMESLRRELEALRRQLQPAEQGRPRE
jgi:RNA polymerase sigma factor (sigma-70 family)